jgi:hypothetical protein
MAKIEPLEQIICRESSRCENSVCVHRRLHAPIDSCTRFRCRSINGRHALDCERYLKMRKQTQ